jgi:uncharacterized membrane protein
MNKTIKTIIFFVFVFFTFLFSNVYAQDNNDGVVDQTSDSPQVQLESASEDVEIQEQPKQVTYKGLILEITDEGTETVYGIPQKYIVYKTRILNGDKKGEEIEIQTAVYQDSASYQFTPGNKVILLHTLDSLGNDVYYITDYLRTGSMILLALIFSVLVVLVSKKWGITSIIGLVYSFFVIFKFILPRLAIGNNPVLIAIIGACLIAPVTFYLSHGLNRKTTLALLSTIISLIVTGILAAVFVKVSYLTGYGTEEAFFLQYAKNEIVDIRGLLLAGIIIGTLGVLDDVTVSQAATVFQLKKANKKLEATELFHMAMEVGHDHIASMVNTLVLVYTGATLPLLLLFINSPVPAFEIVNSEIIAEEVIRTLVGSIGLVLAVPITTLISSKYYQESNTKVKK